MPDFLSINFEKNKCSHQVALVGMVQHAFKSIISGLMNIHLNLHIHYLTIAHPWNFCLILKILQNILTRGR